MMLSIFANAFDSDTASKGLDLGPRFPRFLVPRRVTIQAFICGCGHSGTTLIATILSAHPSTYVPLRETYIFQDDTIRTRWRHFRLLWRAAISQKRALIEKSPLHINHIDAIRAGVPGARFIIPVRDGRDVVASIVKRNGNLRYAVGRWIKENSIVLAERHNPDVMVYRHEDLIADPVTTLRCICNFLGLEYCDGLLEYHKRERLWFGQREIRYGSGREGKEHHALRNWQVNQPIYDSRGRWRSELNEEDVEELIRGTGRPLMQAFGYL